MPSAEREARRAEGGGREDEEENDDEHEHEHEHEKSGQNFSEGRYFLRWALRMPIFWPGRWRQRSWIQTHCVGYWRIQPSRMRV